MQGNPSDSWGFMVDFLLDGCHDHLYFLLNFQAIKLLSFTEKPRYISQVDAAKLCLWLVEALRYKTKKLSVKRIPLYSLLLL